MSEMTDIAIVVVQKGFNSYKDLALWTKKNVKTYTTQGGEYTYFESICALYQLHFGLSEEEAKRLVDLMCKMGFWSYAWAPATPQMCYFEI